VSDLADLPRGLLSLEQWDALELDPTRRWELSEGTLIMSPRPQVWHQRISKRLTRLLDDHLPDGLEALPEIEVITRSSFPPSVRDPDIVVVPDRVFERRPAPVPAADVVLVAPQKHGADYCRLFNDACAMAQSHNGCQVLESTGSYRVSTDAIPVCPKSSPFHNSGSRVSSASASMSAATRIQHRRIAPGRMR
jgi:hypothetical protein